MQFQNYQKLKIVVKYRSNSCFVPPPECYIFYSKRGGGTFCPPRLLQEWRADIQIANDLMQTTMEVPPVPM